MLYEVITASAPPEISPKISPGHTPSVTQPRAMILSSVITSYSIHYTKLYEARAAVKKIHPDELSGGTFSVTNPGQKGNLFGTPIINQPQVGILRMGQIIT